MRTLFVIALLSSVFAGDVQAQLFGSRSLGSPISRRPGSGGAFGAGRVSGNERFVRGNRSRSAFVGSDRRDLSGFVGNNQGRSSGRVMSATAGLRRGRDSSMRINRPLKLPDSDEPYLPQLTVAFSTPTVTSQAVADRLQKEFAESPQFSAQSRFEVLVVERTAILRGEVTSVRERGLAELLATFEPGISHVRNELRLAQPQKLESPSAKNSRATGVTR